MSTVFSSTGLYEFVIPEDLPVGKIGGKVRANDRDIGENGKSTYGIIEGDDQGTFEIIMDPQTQEGLLRLKRVSKKKVLRLHVPPPSQQFQLQLALAPCLFPSMYLTKSALIGQRSCQIFSEFPHRHYAPQNFLLSVHLLPVLET